MVKGEYCAGQVGEIGFSHGGQIEDFVRRFGTNRPIVVRYDPENIDSSTVRLEDNPDLDVGILAGRIIEDV